MDVLPLGQHLSEAAALCALGELHLLGSSRKEPGQEQGLQCRQSQAPGCLHGLNPKLSAGGFRVCDLAHRAHSAFHMQPGQDGAGAVLAEPRHDD